MMNPWKEMKDLARRLFPCGQGLRTSLVILNARKTRHTYRERPKGKLPFHSYIDSFITISIHIKDTYRDHSLHFFIYLCFNYAYFLNFEFDITYQTQDGRA